MILLKGRKNSLLTGRNPEQAQTCVGDAPADAEGQTEVTLNPVSVAGAEEQTSSY